MALILRGLVMVVVLGGFIEEKIQMIQGTSGSSNDALEIHSGGLVVREGSAGAAFGTMRAGKGKRQLSYFVVFKHRLEGAGKSDFTEEALAEDAGGESKQSLTIDGKTVQVVYNVNLDPDSKKVSRETLTVNKKSVNPAKGRVFLVDLTVNPPKWEQRKVNLPSEVAEATTKKAADELVKKVMASLMKQDSKVKTFVEAAAK